MPSAAEPPSCSAPTEPPFGSTTGEIVTLSCALRPNSSTWREARASLPPPRAPLRRRPVRGTGAGAPRLAAADGGSPAASAMRRSHAELPPTEGTATATVTVPLRGCRRALGTFTFEGVRVEAGGEFALLDRADELGRQLSAAIENIQLLDDVVRSRNELENAFDSIANLIVASDRQGRIVTENRGFANPTGRGGEGVVDPPLRDVVGPELAAWLAMHTRVPHRDAPPATFETV